MNGNSRTLSGGSPGDVSGDAPEPEHGRRRERRERTQGPERREDREDGAGREEGAGREHREVPDARPQRETRAPGGGPAGPCGPLAPHADLLARLALANVRREYPNAPAHLLAGPDELVTPRTYHPAFYGAYDWHSSVHMHWLLMRLLRRCPAQIDAGQVTRALDAHLTPAGLGAEAGYLRAHPAFERPYGWAWLLTLAAESNALGADSWSDALTPLTYTVAELLLTWLPDSGYPVRHGTHANSAFALGLVLDSAERAGVPELTEPVTEKLHEWFAGDHGAATRWEPSGSDFLSPVLCEADAMRRVLPREEFAGWLTGFLPELSAPGAGFLPPPLVADPTDPQTGHLLGLCLSRATALSNLAGALPAGDPRCALFTEAAGIHLTAGLPAAATGDFTTEHWLATFAALALEAAEPVETAQPA